MRSVAELNGQYVLPGVTNIWDKVSDPCWMTECLPGTEHIKEDVDKGRVNCEIVSDFQLAKGRFHLVTDLSARTPRESVSFVFQTLGSTSSVLADATIDTWEEDKATYLKWRLRILDMGGILKYATSEMVEAAARKMVWRTFDNAFRRLKEEKKEMADGS